TALDSVATQLALARHDSSAGAERRTDTAAARTGPAASPVGESGGGASAAPPSSAADAIARSRAARRAAVRELVAPRRAPPPTCEPGPGYNADGACFDERPKPVAPPFVPLPADADPHPGPSILWVKVSTDGKTLAVDPLRPSRDGAFERDVRAFAKDMTWYPATKGGTPVEAWTQMIFRPAITGAQ
ncbi:MAG TPA: hypothetical protein VFW66_14440, partial [Gemmatimonadales bacterium]|nr:hypothetical protein [Gemmatimonadales bacterium]